MSPIVGFCPGLRGPRSPIRRHSGKEYWTADSRQFVIWCPACGLTCTITLGLLTATEPEH